MIDDRYPTETLDPENEDDGTMPDNVDELRQAVVGHRIVNVERGKPLGSDDEYLYHGYPERHATLITLDNGRTVELVDTSDCCAYTEMRDVLYDIDAADHVILGVGTTDGYETWHIYADLGDVMRLKVGWSAGNPFWYGYGFYIFVRDPEAIS